MTLEYKNSQISYKVHGSGESVLLLHGFLENQSMWDDFIPSLSQTKKVITVDLLGHGNSDSLGYVHTMEDMANAVYHVLNHLDVEICIVVGHSMGGYVALALAELYPNLVTDLCLMNSTFLNDHQERIELRLRAVEVAKENYESLVRTSFTGLFAPESVKRFKSDFDNVLKIALNTSVQGYIGAQLGMAQRPNRLHVLNKVSGKKYIIVGKKDNLVDPKAISEMIANSSIEMFELSEGHMSHIENKSDLSYLLLRFI